MKTVPMRAIVADGDNAIRRDIVAVLDEFNAVVSEVETLDQLVKSVDNHRPDLLLVDLDMAPVVQIKELRSKCPSMNVLMTFAAELSERVVEDLGAMLEVGTTDFLRKPFDRTQLLHRIRVLDALTPSLRLGTGREDTDSLLLRLHHRGTGRLDASLMADFIKVPLKVLSTGLGRDYRAVHKTPHAPSLQRDLKDMRRIIELLLGLVGNRVAMLAWLNTPSPDLAGETPLELIKKGHADSVRSLLENVAAGAPA